MEEALTEERMVTGMKYFQSVVDFVDANLFWVVVAFFAATFIEFIVFLVKKIRSGDEFDTNNFYISVVTNIVVLLGIYVLSCLCVGLVNCIRDQDWHFATNYYGKFLWSGTYWTIATIAFIAALIVAFIATGDTFDGFIEHLIVSAIAAVLIVAALTFVVGFVIYVIVAFIIIVLKVVWFVVSGFFISIYQFIIKYWLAAVFVIVTPGVIYGCVCALINYISSLKDEVFDYGNNSW